ncbi:MAG TPA: hypothetical protein PK867_10565 [Pirellulales bacterium]|nr:hypothetical protein [Pirellulales bacterium]
MRISVLCPLALIVAAVFLVSAGAAAEPDRGGVLPLGADGKPLNLDFETGTLRDWKAEGEAFVGQPVEGDAVFARRNDMRSQHVGRFWIGTYERRQDPPQGTLTSVAFEVTHPYCSFLVAGGPHPETCVQLVRKDTGKVVYQTSGETTEDLKPVTIGTAAVGGTSTSTTFVFTTPSPPIPPGRQRSRPTCLPTRG